LSSELLETDRRFRRTFVCGSATAGTHKTTVIDEHGRQRHRADLVHQVFRRSLNLREANGAAVEKVQILIPPNEWFYVERVGPRCDFKGIVRAAKVHAKRATDQLRTRHFEVAHQHCSIGSLQQHLVHDGGRQHRLSAACPR
jgi:hypothetical protein